MYAGSGMEVANGLKCSCLIEYVSDNGQALRKQVLKTARLDLGRNEVEDVVILISHPQGKLGPYTLRDHSIHKRFVSDGKATIRLITQKMHLLISNCPSDQLRVFLHSMTVKLAARGKAQGSHRRMLGDVSVQFDEISPLNEKDLEMARRNAGRGAGAGGKCVTPRQKPGLSRTGKENLTTPRRIDTCPQKGIKRKLSEMDPQKGDDQKSNPTKRPVVFKSSGLPLSKEQTQVLQAIKNGESVFFTGSAGTGKSYLLKKIISSMPPDSTFCTASTGAAASLVGGTTVHAFAGIGTGKGSMEHCIQLASREQPAANWRRCECLIIDEISMIDGEFFDKMEEVARMLRRSRKPFGGIQLVVCGDFLQLPPVGKDGEEKSFCFQAHSWRSCITRSIELTEIYRQSDKQFIAVLQNIRIGRCPPAVAEILRSTATNQIEKGGIRATQLYTHTEDVESTNLRALRSLGGEGRKFTAVDSDPQMSKAVDHLCPVGSCIELKVGAQVMLTKNIDVGRGLVNGARGVVREFESTKGYPVVQFTSGLRLPVCQEKWSVRASGGVVVTRRQLPLKLAWAISIHKSQGMTLDCVEMSLSRCFEDGQAYVALSRAKSLQSLRVKDFDPKCVRAKKEVLDFYRALRQMRRNYIEYR